MILANVNRNGLHSEKIILEFAFPPAVSSSDDGEEGTHPCGFVHENGFFTNMLVGIAGTKPSNTLICDSPDCFYTKDWLYDSDTSTVSAVRINNGDVNSTRPYLIVMDLSDGQFTCFDSDVEGSCQKICGNNECTLH